MSRITNLVRQGRELEIWHMCCGFVDLNLEQFMTIQQRLLLEQITLLNRCQLGRKIMGSAIPETIKDFRARVPLTTYSDYCPELLEMEEDVLPGKPVLWQHTSGKTGEYSCKWVPLTERFCEELAKILLGVAILSGCEGRYKIVKLREYLRMVYAVAPRPYTSGTLVHVLDREFPLTSFPSLEDSEQMSFEDRIREGFRQALYYGLDGFCGLSLALVAVGEQFRNRATKTAIVPLLKHPKALLRLVKGLIKSKLAGRPLLPRDIWNVLGIMSGGTDSAVLKERVKELWGRYPLDTYTSTEGCVIATQTWDYDTMTFIPNLNFLEFIHEDECYKEQLNPGYKPKTVLLDEVRPGELYEIVITNFHGGAMVRYRIGDMVRITAPRNEKADISIPQMTFERRTDDLIDLGGYVRLTEKMVWQAIENSGIPYEDWTVRKEIGEKPIACIYLELGDGYQGTGEEVAEAIYGEIKKLDGRINSLSIYNTLESLIGTIPVKVCLLPSGAFPNYVLQRREEGAELAHLKPPHINPSDEVLSRLGARSEYVSAPVSEAETIALP